jgi:hypothetical protein
MAQVFVWHYDGRISWTKRPVSTATQVFNFGESWNPFQTVATANCDHNGLLRGPQSSSFIAIIKTS